MAAANDVNAVSFRAILEGRSAYSIRLLRRAYFRVHSEHIKALLDREDARASRLDMRTYSRYIDELSEGWLDEANIGCYVIRKDDTEEEVPIAIAIASKREYRDGARRPTELNWERTQMYLGVEDQWCLEYLVRSRGHRGSGVGCFALAGLLECFCRRFDNGVMWLLLAGGFTNRSALSLYTSVGFLVTSLDGDKTPIMSLQVEDAEQRALRTLRDTLTLRHAGGGGAVIDGEGSDDGGGDGNGNGDGDGGGGGDDGADDLAGASNSDEDEQRAVRQLRRRIPRRIRREYANNQRRDDGARRAILDRIHFGTMADHLRLSNCQLVLPPHPDGLEEDLIRHMWSMSDMASLNTHSQSFLIHLNVAKQCHHIAFHRRMHVSRWIAEQRQQHREDQEWNRRFGASLTNDVLLLWNVFRMPCLQLLNIGYYTATRPGGLKDIVRACEQLLENDQPLPHSILTAQQEMHKYCTLYN